MKRNSTATVVIGLALIALGLIIAGNMLELWSFSLYFDGWWTLFIIVPCLMAIINGGFDVFPAVGLTVGVLLLLDAQDVWSFAKTVRILIPIAIIALGLRIIFKPSGWHCRGGINSKMSGSYTAIFSGSDNVLENELFTGCDTCAIFGGLKLDIRNCRFEGESRIDAVSVFGGTEIHVPTNVRVITECVGILGGTEYNRPPLDLPENAPVLRVGGVSAFGGIEIKQY